MGAGAGAAVLAGALTVWLGGSFTPSMAMRTLESSCRGMLPSSEEKGLGGFSKHISQLVLPVMADRDRCTHQTSNLQRRGHTSDVDLAQITNKNSLHKV